MKQDLDAITQNDLGAIIVVAGDHGPYLTKNCTDTASAGYDISTISRLDIQDRFGSLLAIRWPSEDYSKYDHITVLQDVFPAIFAYLFQHDGLLEAKVTPTTIGDSVASGVSVKNGIIYGGINDGEPLYASQAAALLSVTTNAATGVTETTATMNGTLTGVGGAASVTVSFDAGLTTEYGSVVGNQTMTTAGAFSYSITSGLTPNAAYHCRAKAVVGNSTVYGADLKFTTQ